MAKVNGGIIGPANIPTGAFGSAPGVWKLSEAEQYKKEGIWPVATTGFQVANSCRFDDGSSDYLSKANSDPIVSNTTATFSVWIKRSTLSSDQSFFGSYLSTDNMFILKFSSDDKLQVYSKRSASVKATLKTTRLLRDVGAWMHVVVAIDTTQATAADRIKVYINGVQETSFSTNTQPIQNENLYIDGGAGTNYYVGQRGGSAEYFDGYLSECFFIMGTAYDADTFGETDATTGNWIPKDVSGLTFGTKGFYLPFQNAAALGQDDSGNGNNFTVNNLTSIDQCIDSPTNNFATFNPLIKPTTDNLTIANGNLSRTNGTSAAWTQIYTTLGVSSGKYYYEAKIDSTSNADGFLFGIADVDSFNNSSGVNIGTVTRNYVYQSNGNKRTSGTDTSFGASLTTGDIIGVAFDLDNNYIYFAKNGVWQNSGDPTSGASGTGSAFSITSGYTYSPAFATYYTTDDFSANFGNAPFTISSGNTDFSGLGNFEYEVPSGYRALCTKNIGLVG